MPTRTSSSILALATLSALTAAACDQLNRPLSSTSSSSSSSSSSGASDPDGGAAAGDAGAGVVVPTFTAQPGDVHL